MTDHFAFSRGVKALPRAQKHTQLTHMEALTVFRDGTNILKTQSTNLVLQLK